MTDLENFAAAVRFAASTHPEGSRFRFGRWKVFIAALRPNQVTRRLLVEAHLAGLLRLCRADLVPAMDPAIVAASETTYLNASYHFIDLE